MPLAGCRGGAPVKSQIQQIGKCDGHAVDECGDGEGSAFGDGESGVREGYRRCGSFGDFDPVREHGECASRRHVVRCPGEYAVSDRKPVDAGRRERKGTREGLGDRALHPFRGDCDDEGKLAREPLRKRGDVHRDLEAIR